MSINWVMTSATEQGFIRLPNERLLHTSPLRTSIQLGTSTSYTGDDPYTLRSESGVIHITNQRIVYLPSAPKPEFKSFSAPILNITDSRVRAPFFGANYWEAMCKPVPGGGLPATHPVLELRVTFREGGAFDFHSTFEQIKERLYNAYTIAREHGTGGSSGVDLTNVDLEQLPAYEPAIDVTGGESVADHTSPTLIGDNVEPRIANDLSESMTRPPDLLTPDEPPPMYEETQAQPVDEAMHEVRTSEAGRKGIR